MLDPALQPRLQEILILLKVLASGDGFGELSISKFT